MFHTKNWSNQILSCKGILIIPDDSQKKHGNKRVNLQFKKTTLSFNYVWEKNILQVGQALEAQSVGNEQERNYGKVDKAQGNDACDKTFTDFPKAYCQHT